MNGPAMRTDFESASLRLCCLVIFGFMVLLVITGCVNRNTADKKVVALLDECPSWTRLRPNNHPDREKIMACLAKIRTYDIRVVRTALENYVAANTNGGSQNIENLSKIFVLNRYFFQVPQFVPAESPIFGAWRNPIENGQLDLLWPFTLNPDRRLELTGAFSGYTGEPYRPIEEFDYFSKTFGIRH